MHLVRPLAQLAGRGAGERAMQGIRLGQQADVFKEVAPRKRRGRRSPTIIDSTVIGELLNTACHLRTREAGHLAQILTQHAFVGACTVAIMKLLKRVGHPAVSGDPIRQRKRDGFVAGNKGLHLGQRF